VESDQYGPVTSGRQLMALLNDDTKRSFLLRARHDVPRTQPTTSQPVAPLASKTLNMAVWHWQTERLPQALSALTLWGGRGGRAARRQRQGHQWAAAELGGWPATVGEHRRRCQIGRPYRSWATCWSCSGAHFGLLFEWLATAFYLLGDANLSYFFTCCRRLYVKNLATPSIGRAPILRTRCTHSDATNRQRKTKPHSSNLPPPPNDDVIHRHCV